MKLKGHKFIFVLGIITSYILFCKHLSMSVNPDFRADLNSSQNYSTPINHSLSGSNELGGRIVQKSKVQNNGLIPDTNESRSLTSGVPECFRFKKKIWPAVPIRGVNMKLVVSTKPDKKKPGSFFTDKTFHKLSKWRVNVIRVSVGVDAGSIWDVKKDQRLPPVPPDDPMAPYKNHLKGLEIALDLAKEYDIFVVVTAGNIVGRKIDTLYHKKSCVDYHQLLIDLWTNVAKRFAHHSHLLAFDLLNEPQFKRGDDSWQRMILPKLIEKIREIDKETYVIIEPGPWGLPNGFRYLKPVNDTKAIYSFHFYSPHNYTHQGVRKRPKGLIYPGMLRHFDTSRRLYWDRDQFKKGVEVAREFQKKYGVRMFVGEFSVIRWAPGAARWLEDAISIFEEYGWDWCYHSYGGWNGWNPTFSSDDPENNKQDGGKETDRLKVLTKAWSKNQSKNLQPEIEINRE